MQALCRTGPDAPAAADTLRRTRYLLKGKPHRAGIFTGMAGNTLLFFPMDLNQAETIEPAVYGSQWAQILAEGPVDLYGEHKKHQQNSKLPKEQTSCLAAQKLIPRKQGKSSKQRSRRTQIFAEGRNLCKTAKEKRRADTYQKDKNHIFPVFKH